VTLDADHLLGLVDVSNNLLTNITIRGCSVGSLRELHLANNDLDELDLDCPKMRVLDVSSNQISRATSTLSSMTILERFDFSFNLLRELPTLNGRISTLLGTNNLLHHLPTLSAALETLRLSDNLMSGTLPSSIVFKSLVHVEIQRNAICGTLPLTFVNPSLSHLDASFNNLRGTLPTDAGLSELVFLDITSNNFEGTIPLQLAALSRTLETIRLGVNMFSGTIPSNLAECSLLTTVDFSANELRGSLPEWILLMERLRVIELSRNHLIGTLPSTILNRVTDLSLTNNELSGTIPDTLATLPSLTTLRLSANLALSGTLPDRLWRLRTLAIDDTRLVALNLPTWVHAGTQLATYARGGVVLRCPALHSNVISLETHPRLYEWRFCVCASGFQGVHGRCSECPSGADCFDGSRLHVRRGFWCDAEAYRSGRGVVCSPCTPNRCCSSTQCELEHQCASGFSGTVALCGACAANYTVGMPEKCVVSRANCNDRVWLIPTVLIAAFVYVGYLVTTWRPVKNRCAEPLSRLIDCLISVFIYFYQILPLLLGSSLQRSAASGGRAILSFFTSLFTLSPEGLGLCFAPDLTMAQGMSINLLGPAALCLAVCVLLGISTVVTRLHWANPTTTSGPVSRALSRGSYAHAALSVTELAFSTTVKTVFELVQCVDVGGTIRLLHAGGVECYTPWQVAVLLASVPLVLYPVFLLRLAHLARRHHMRPNHADRSGWSGTYHSLCSPYLPRAARFWAAIVLLRRLSLIFLATFIPDVVWRAWSLAFGCVLFLSSTLVIRPHVFPSCILG